MCFSSPPPPATPEPAPAPPPPALPTAQAASAALAASPSQQIGFARKAENKKRFGKKTGPQGRRDASADNRPAPGPSDSGSGIRM